MRRTKTKPLFDRRRRAFLKLLLSLSWWAGFCPRSTARLSQIAIGAIRWDAWYADDESGVRLAVEKTLGPQKYHGRAPYFALQRADGTIIIDGNQQAVLDNEIKIASRAGLQFWAYCFYENISPLMNAWKLHQSSEFRNEIFWCMILQSPSFVSAQLQKDRDYFHHMFQKSNYQKVLSNRPLLFILDGFGQIAELASMVDSIRQNSLRSGSNPYIALMTADPKAAAERVVKSGCDAISSYSIGHPETQSRYRDLTKRVQDLWDHMLTARIPAIPLAMTGEDRRPRVENPVPWEPNHWNSKEGLNQFYESGTPSEIANHVLAMVKWIRMYPQTCPTQTGIIYSWDECDEGGSTLLPELDRSRDVLGAVAKVLR